jgi:hypothetical protein
MTRNIAASCVSNFCKAKAKERGARDPSPPYKAHKGAKYGIYLILVAVVSMMALYALIIVGCLKQPK